MGIARLVCATAALASGLITKTSAAEPNASYLLNTGNDYVAECPNTGRIYPLCLAYVHGLADGLSIVAPGGRLMVCYPKGMTMGQLWTVVNQWIYAHPADWHLALNELVAKALYDSFACPRK